MSWTELLVGFGAGGVFVLLLSRLRLRLELGTAPKTPESASSESTVERVFRAQDDDLASPVFRDGVFGLPPAASPPSPSPVPSQPVAEVRTMKIEVPGHSCFHLSGTRPPNFTEAQCSGTCMHRAQTGRLCFWPSQTASQCPTYSPKVVLAAKPKGAA